MALPPITTIAACGSILTAFKSGWELSRMIKKKDLEKRMDRESRAVLRDLQDAYTSRLIGERSFEKWYDRLLAAIASKDGEELGKVRAHLTLIHQESARATRRNTQANRTTYDDDKYHNHHHHHHHHHKRARSADRQRSSRPEYSVYEYEEKSHRPSRVDTIKAQRDYYYAHALPSPYKGEIEYTPLDEEFGHDSTSSEDDGSRRSHRNNRGRSSRAPHSSSSSSKTESYRSQSSSTVDRGQTRSRSRSQSIQTETRKAQGGGESSASDADSDAQAHHHDGTRRRDAQDGGRSGRSRGGRG